jgi:hypothetical protein
LTTSQTSLEKEPTEPAKVEGEVKAAKTEDKTLADPGDATVGAPEKYDSFKLPEGYTLDEKSAETATAIFKELNLSQEQAQKLVDFYVQNSLEASEAPIKYYAEMRQGWRDEVIKDTSIGNGSDGLKPEVKSAIASVINSLGELAGPFREAMNITGVGDHPAFVRAMYSLSKRLAEGRHVSGNSPSRFGQGRQGQPTGPGAAALFPSLPSATQT